MHVVVVDDEPRMVELIAGYSEENDLRVTAAHDVISALDAARQVDVDAVVLDVMLPGMSATEVCQQLRREGNDVPILMLTARGAVSERVSGLEAGADDYLVKPFALEELHARLRAIRRRREPEGARLVVGDVVLDAGDRRVLNVCPRRVTSSSLLGCKTGREITAVSRATSPATSTVTRSRSHHGLTHHRSFAMLPLRCARTIAAERSAGVRHDPQTQARSSKSNFNRSRSASTIAQSRSKSWSLSSI